MLSSIVITGRPIFSEGKRRRSGSEAGEEMAGIGQRGRVEVAVGMYCFMSL